MPHHHAVETSHDLLQHVNHPVDWSPWAETARAIARQQDRPMILSIADSPCHRCPVIEHPVIEHPVIEHPVIEHKNFEHPKIFRLKIARLMKE